MLDIDQLLLHLAAPPKIDSNSTVSSCLDVLDIDQLLLHLAAVSTAVRTTPGHNCPRDKNGSKSTASSCLDVLDIDQLLLHLAARSQLPPKK